MVTKLHASNATLGRGMLHKSYNCECVLFFVKYVDWREIRNFLPSHNTIQKSFLLPASYRYNSLATVYNGRN